MIFFMFSWIYDLYDIDLIGNVEIRIYMNFEQKVTNPVGLKNDEKRWKKWCFWSILALKLG